MKHKVETAAFGFFGTVAFTFMSLTQVWIGLSLFKKWDMLTVLFAVMAGASAGLAVYFARTLLEEVRRRHAAKSPARQALQRQHMTSA